MGLHKSRYIYMMIGTLSITPRYRQQFTQVVDNAARYFIGLCNQGSSLQLEFKSEQLQGLGVISHKCTPVNCTCMLHNLENAFFQVLKGRYVKKFQAYLLHLLACYSQPSSKVRCGREWHFQKPVFSIGQCKLKAIYFTKSKLNLSGNVSVFYLFHIFSRILTFHSELQGVTHL